jgi:hypothetical protein
MMFTSRARALSEMALALWAMENDSWSLVRPTPEEFQAYTLIEAVVRHNKQRDKDELWKWLKESAEGRGAFT